jgi:hypothetical protein
MRPKRRDSDADRTIETVRGGRRLLSQRSPGSALARSGFRETNFGINYVFFGFEADMPLYRAPAPTSDMHLDLDAPLLTNLDLVHR